MTKTTETPTAASAVTATPITPDGTLITQANSQTFIMQVFFNHNSKETFQDKLLRVMLAEEMMEKC